MERHDDLTDRLAKDSGMPREFGEELDKLLENVAPGAYANCSVVSGREKDDDVACNERDCSVDMI